MLLPLLTTLALTAPLSEARSAYDALEYERCRTQAKAALEAPGTRDERIDAYRLLGLCHAALDDTEPAREAFIAMLAIDPAAKLPDGLSPRFTSSYLEAKGHFVGEEPLTLSLARSEIEGGKRVVLLEVHDPLEQVDKVAVRAGDTLGPGLKAARRMELELPASEAAEIVALDANRGEVAVLAVAPEGAPAPKPSELAALTEPPKEPEAVEPPSGGSDLWLWLGVGAGASVLVAGAAAAGVGFALAQPASVSLRSQVVFGDDP